MQDDLPLGAHLTTPRRGFVHHGLYAGHGRVIHYAGYGRVVDGSRSRWRRGPVEEVTLEQFTRGRGLRVVAVVAPAYVGAAALARARSRLGEDRYSLWSNNCEHFVEWALSGIARSAQVEAWKALPRGVWLPAPAARPAAMGRQGVAV